MKLPSSSSFVAAALIASSSIPSLAAPATVPSKDPRAISSGNQFVTSRSENIVHRTAEKDDVHKEDADRGEKGLLSDLIGKVFCLLKLGDCNKGSEHKKRFENAAPQTSPRSESELFVSSSARDLRTPNGGSSDPADAGQPS